MKNQESPIRVYLQYPWKVVDSPYYKSLVKNPPSKVNFLDLKKNGVITSASAFSFLTSIKRRIRNFLNRVNFAIPNAHLSPPGDYDLIHCAHCISKNRDVPWVADIESRWSLFVSGHFTKKGQDKVRKILLDNSCKKILPWTEHTRNQIVEMFPEVSSKIEVLYPAVKVPKLNLKGKSLSINKKITVLFVARYFWLKGGKIALDVLERLRKKYNLRIIFISIVPEEIKKEYPSIEIRGLVSSEILEKFYLDTDVFFYPSLGETFGFTLLEAMAFGIPIVTVNTPKTISRKEIISNEENGLITEITKDFNSKQDYIDFNLDPPETLVNSLHDNLAKIIENDSLRNKISRNSLKIMNEGKFSIQERNRKLRRIYREALK
jgi:glycosyltransferase involved in cell wall biosynthesis